MLAAKMLTLDQTICITFQLWCQFCIPKMNSKSIRFISPGVYLDSEELQPPSLRAEPSQPEEAGLGFWLVRPGGGLEGAATGSGLGDRGTFQSSWAKEELDTEPPPGDHFDSLGLAAIVEKSLV